MLTGEISIFRINNGANDIRLEITDDKSRNRFLEIVIDPKDLMLALTGFSGKPIKYEIHNTHVLGMVKETEDVSVTILSGEVGSTFTTKEEFVGYLEAYEHEITGGHGWRISTYLGSQKSIVKNKDGSTTLNTTKFRYMK